MRQARTERTFKHPGSRQPFWWKMLYSHLLELQSMIATTRWRWKCCKREEGTERKQGWLECELWRTTKGTNEHHIGPTVFLHYANKRMGLK